MYNGTTRVLRFNTPFPKWPKFPFLSIYHSIFFLSLSLNRIFKGAANKWSILQFHVVDWIRRKLTDTNDTEKADGVSKNCKNAQLYGWRNRLKFPDYFRLFRTLLQLGFFPSDWLLAWPKVRGKEISPIKNSDREIENRSQRENSKGKMEKITLGHCRHSRENTNKSYKTCFRETHFSGRTDQSRPNSAMCFLKARQRGRISE